MKYLSVVEEPEDGNIYWLAEELHALADNHGLIGTAEEAEEGISFLLVISGDVQATLTRLKRLLGLPAFRVEWIDQPSAQARISYEGVVKFARSAEAAENIAEVMSEFSSFIHLMVGPDGDLDLDAIRRDVEAFVGLWQRLSAELGLDPDDQRTGDALAVMAEEVSKSSAPPLRVLWSAFGWFAHKMDVFAEEAARSAGKAVGPAIVVGAGGAAAPQLIAAVHRVIQSLGGG